MPLELIDDGYTLNATAKADGWPSVVFTYRPALPTAVRNYVIARERSKDGLEEMKAIVTLLTEHVISWDVVSNKQPVPVTEATVRRVPDPLQRRMIDIVTGYANSEIVRDEKNSASGSASS